METEIITTDTFMLIDIKYKKCNVNDDMLILQSYFKPNIEVINILSNNEEKDKFRNNIKFLIIFTSQE